jgi:hypothetical protein
MSGLMQDLRADYIVNRHFTGISPDIGEPDKESGNSRFFLCKKLDF